MSLEASEIAQRLADCIDSTLTHLLGGNGQKQNKHMCYADKQGGRGKSMKVTLNGPHRGNWRDFNTGERGDLLDLWALSRSINIVDAMVDSQRWLGISPTKQEHNTISKQWTLPKRPNQLVLALNHEKGRDYLINERRISEGALRDYMVCYDCSADAIAFPYLTAAGASPVRYKFLKIERSEHGKKQMWSTKNPEPCLFGWQAIPPVCREAVVTEGEIDALSVASFGGDTYGLSIPNGAGDLSWIDQDYERLSRLDTIYLMLDNDVAGQNNISTIVERLGPHRCLVVAIPEGYKDANDLRASYTKADFDGLLQDARPLDPEGITSIGDIREQVKTAMREGFDNGLAIEMPFPVLHNKLRLRPTEVSLLAGINGHGKTELASQISLCAIQQGYKVGVASLEWSKPLYASRMLRQATCMDAGEISEAYVDHCLDYYDGKMFLFGCTGTNKFDSVLSNMKYLRRRYGIDLFVIDNLAKLGFDEDDYNGQKHVVDALTDFTNEHNCHVMLVLHIRKVQSESIIPDKMDIKGSGAIADMAKTILFIWRHKEKERVSNKKRAGQAISSKEESILAKSDAVFGCVKQNGGEWEGRAYLDFHPVSHRFTDGNGIKPTPFVNYSNLGEDDG